MTLQERKLQIINQLVHTSNPEFIEQVEALLKKSARKAYEKNLKPMTEQELIERALKSEADIKAGRVQTWEEVKKELGWDDV